MKSLKNNLYEPNLLLVQSKIIKEYLNPNVKVFVVTFLTDNFVNIIYIDYLN